MVCANPYPTLKILISNIHVVTVTFNAYVLDLVTVTFNALYVQNNVFIFQSE